MPQIPKNPPLAQGTRLLWSAVPERVKQGVAKILGSPVVETSSQSMGFSPGVAARAQLADGQRIFIKAISPEQNPDAPAMHRREARIVASLPNSVAVPRHLATYDEGDAGWVVIIFEDIAGTTPTTPWQANELARVLAAMQQLAKSLTPSSLPKALQRRAETEFTHHICGWQKLLEGPSELRAVLDPWSQEHLENLVDLERRAAKSAAGDTTLHFDLRADNLILTSEKVWFVDWPHACIGAAWVDWVSLAPSVTMQGGPLPEVLLSQFQPAPDRERLLAVVAAFAGYFTYNALQQPPPGLPTLRAFQAAQGNITRDWLARIL